MSSKVAWVTGLGLWSPGYADPEAWFLDEQDPEVRAPTCELVPSRQRRGTSLVTRMGLEVMGQAARRGGADLTCAGMIFGSAHGELQTAVTQFEMMELQGRLSPMRFKNSVHNTATGLLTIAFENRGFSTAIAGGAQTFASCLLEGLLLLAGNGGEVVVGTADDSLSEPLCRAPSFDPLGVALCLTSEQPPEGGLGRVVDFAGGHDVALGEIPDRVRHNPAAAGLPLLRALYSGTPGRVPIALEGPTTPSIEVLIP